MRDVPEIAGQRHVVCFRTKGPQLGHIGQGWRSRSCRSCRRGYAREHHRKHEKSEKPENYLPHTDLLISRIGRAPNGIQRNPASYLAQPAESIVLKGVLRAWPSTIQRKVPVPNQSLR